MTFSKFCVLVTLVGSVAVAHAQPGPGDGPPPPPEGEPAPPPPPAPPPGAPQFAQPAVVQPAPPAPASTVDRGVLEDANSDRSWLMPSALTPPAGTWSFSDYELLMVGVAYSPSDQLSLGVTTMLPLTDDFPLLVIGNAKYQFLKTGNLRMVLQGALVHFRDTSGSTTASATAGNVGAAGTLCLDADCYSHLSGFIGAGFAHQDQSAVPFLVGASLAFRVAKHVKLLVEADSGFIAGNIDAAADGFLLWYGVRFTSANIGVDLALVKPICSGCSDSGIALGLPFINFTYRGLRGGG